MTTLLNDIKNTMADILFPMSCLICNRHGSFVCEKCLWELMPVDHLECVVCRKVTPGGMTHLACRDDLLPDGVISIWNYHDPKVADLIIKGKYSFLPDVYRELSRVVAEQFKSSTFPKAFQDFSFVPIPLAQSRLRWRGFNQAQIIAEGFSNKLGLSINDCLRRQKSTLVQKDLDRKGRQKNVAGCFSVIKEAHDRNLILIDDVITTGATLLEASKILKSAGASSVWCMTLARD